MQTKNTPSSDNRRRSLTAGQSGSQPAPTPFASRGFIIGLLVAVLLAPLCWLIAWLVGLKAAGVATPSVTEVGGVLATIGGLMGAIFTLGGLVIALVTIFSQLSLEERAKRFMVEQFDKLLPDLEARVEHHTRARIYLHDAQEAIERKDWPRAIQLTDQALDENEALPGAASTLALALSQEFANRYYYGTVRARRQEDLDDAYSDTRQWTLRALRAGDNPNGTVQAEAAVLKGYRHHYDEMLRDVREALAANPHLRTTLCDPQRLALLAQGCGNNARRLAALGDALGITLPVPNPNVLASLDQIPPASLPQVVDWIVMGSHSNVARDVLKDEDVQFPLKLEIQVEQSARGLWGMAQYRRSAHIVAEIRIGDDVLLPLADLVAGLSTNFLFVCSAD